LHADSLLWNRNLLTESERGHADLPRWQNGNFALQVLSTVSEAPLSTSQKIYFGGADIFWVHCLWNCWPLATFSSRLERTLYQIQKFDDFRAKSNQRLVPIRTRTEFVSHMATHASTKAVGAILSVEGAHALENNLQNLPILAHRGVRILGLVHLTNNAFGASSSAGNPDTGLTPLGKELIVEATKLGILIDLAHASPRTLDEALVILKSLNAAPLITHTGIQNSENSNPKNTGACNNPRNIFPVHAKKIAEENGIIGIGFFESAVCGTSPDAIAQSISYAIRVVGEKHVALGSDFDGSVAVPVRANRIAILVDAMLKAGLSPSTIGRVLSQNAERYFHNSLASSL
jgi:microsomal dipeptidase-like Zn-dependent dipeptidase